VETCGVSIKILIGLQDHFEVVGFHGHYYGFGQL
jgi:hypothetical protein